MRPEDARAQARLSLLAWIVWLAVFAVAIAPVASAVLHHRYEMGLGRRTRDVRIEICEHLSQPPRPHRRECRSRATSDDANLLAPAMPKSPSAEATSGLDRLQPSGRSAAPAP